MIVDRYPREIVDEANRQDVDLAKVSGKITEIRVRRNAEVSDQDIPGRFTFGKTCL